MNELEEGPDLRVDWSKLRVLGERDLGVVPVVLQNADTGEVLYVAYANEQALRATLESRTAVLWSTSRDEIWYKGASSGDVLDLVAVCVNCEQNSLLYRVRPRAGVCHTRGPDGRTRRRCFYRRLDDDGTALEHVE